MTDERFRLYQGDDLQQVIDAMARQAAALLDDTPTVLLGMLRRGAPLADRLQQAILKLQPDVALRRVDIMVKRYADTLELLHPDTALEAPADIDLRDCRVIVVDDVLYQGYSLFRVFEWLRGQSPDSVLAAVLVDRQRLRLPVHADIVGLTLKIAPGDVIECNVPPFEAEFAIDLWRPAASQG